MIWTYLIIAFLLLVAELIYFRIADKCNIIDKPNERSSHSTLVLRGGGIIFSLSMVVWAVSMGLQLAVSLGFVRILSWRTGCICLARASCWPWPMCCLCGSIIICMRSIWRG